MKALNLHLLTRIHDPAILSMLYQALSGREDIRGISNHEAASLWSLAELLIRHYDSQTFFRTAGANDKDRADEIDGEDGIDKTDGIDGKCKTGEPVCELYGTAEADSDSQTGKGCKSWISFLEGFFFSYTIRHIGKEFDLLKISADGGTILNIELKSEDIGEEKIKRQLEQNRYYLANAAHTIFSFTYVMDTNTLYRLNHHGHMKACPVEVLAEVLERSVFREYLEDGIDRLFRASDYLISPVESPEKFLQGQYFLTNQQFDFKRRILEHFQRTSVPMVSVSGIAGTGKTLLLFDLALELSRRNRVLLIHSGPLREGHLLLNKRLRHVEFRSAGKMDEAEDFSGYCCLLIDEADHLRLSRLFELLKKARDSGLPVILTYDPHHLLNERWQREPVTANIALISQFSTLSLAFSGNIRINRPIYSFLRALLHLSENKGHPDYSCIDVLYADDAAEERLIRDYYEDRGYELIGSPGGRMEDTVIAREYERVIIVLNEEYFYDDALYLHIKSGDESRLRILYEGATRTRERLCLLISGNRELFSQILRIRCQ